MRLTRWIVIGLILGAAIAFVVSLTRPRSHRDQGHRSAILTLCARTLRIS